MGQGDKLFTEALTLWKEEQQPDEAQEKDKSIGRNPELIAKRNDHLLYRNFYYMAYGDKRWEVIRKLLSDEFYLSETTVFEIVMDNAARKRQIIKEKPSVQKLRELYPAMKW